MCFQMDIFVKTRFIYETVSLISSEFCFTWKSFLIINNGKLVNISYEIRCLNWMSLNISKSPTSSYISCKLNEARRQFVSVEISPLLLWHQINVPRQQLEYYPKVVNNYNSIFLFRKIVRLCTFLWVQS